MSKQKLYLVAIDGSEWSDRATERAINLASDTGAAVKLVTVIPWSGYQPIPLEELINRPLIKEEEERNAEESLLNPVLEKYKDSGVTITTEHDWGSPTEVIKKVAKRDHANMVFVGRRGRSRISDLILGSVANSLAHTLGVPIVLVP